MVPVASAKYLLLGVYLSTVLYVQLRGNVRHKLRRLAADHANVLAPYNALMYLFSAVPARPYAEVSQFPELQKITLLPPGSRLGAHRDPFAGSLRYHLGLVTPNSPECFIVVDGEKYYWKDGEAVMFDETYIHTAENRTDVTRVILFCDVERPLSNPIVRALNRTIGRSMIKAAATQNMPGEHVGVLNRVFEYAYKIRILGTRIKAWNRPVYYLLKWLLIGAVLYAALG